MIVDAEYMSDLIKRITSGPPPEEWAATPAVITISDDGVLTFECVDKQDAERTLFSILVLSHGNGE